MLYVAAVHWFTVAASLCGHYSNPGSELCLRFALTRRVIVIAFKRRTRGRGGTLARAARVSRLSSLPFPPFIPFVAFDLTQMSAICEHGPWDTRGEALSPLFFFCLLCFFLLHFSLLFASLSFCTLLAHILQARVSLAVFCVFWTAKSLYADIPA